MLFAPPPLLTSMVLAPAMETGVEPAQAAVRIQNKIRRRKVVEITHESTRTSHGIINAEAYTRDNDHPSRRK